MAASFRYNKIYKDAGQAPRCRRSKKTKNKMRTTQPAGHGFLKYQFSSIWDCYPIVNNEQAIENSFYSSLVHLTKLYSLDSSGNSKQVFPFNILNDFEKIKSQLEKKHPDINLIISLNAKNEPCLCTVKVHNTGCQLYYIPVRPVYQLLKDKKRIQAGELLLSVFSYLYHILKIPYYRSEYSYLDYCYTSIEEYLTKSEDGDEDDSDYYTTNKKSYKLLRKEGDWIQSKIENQIHLNCFEKRIDNFEIKQPGDAEIFAIASQALSLYKNHPEMSLFNLIPENILNPQEDERIKPEQYISFFWDAHENEIYHDLMVFINDHFQNFGTIDEPLVFQLFDSPQNEARHDLSLPTSLLEMIEKLSDTLINLYD